MSAGTTGSAASEASHPVTTFAPLHSSAPVSISVSAAANSNGKNEEVSSHSSRLSDFSNLIPDSSSLPTPNFQAQRSTSEGKLFNAVNSTMPEKGLSHDRLSSSQLSKRESLKVQKKKYRTEKKKVAKELLSVIKDPMVIVMADWLKIRGTLKGWTKLWCILKPGLFILYKSHKAKSAHWVGTILLSTCELIERPSKKDGFCYKLYHPLDQSIWAAKGPKGESYGAFTQPLPYSYLIFRAPSEAAGKCWMDALELALRCSSLLMRTMTTNRNPDPDGLEEETKLSPFRVATRDQLNESDCERHFKGVEISDSLNQNTSSNVCDFADDSRLDKDEEKSESDTENSDRSDDEKEAFDDDLQPLESPYIPNLTEELGQQGEACQTEEVADENKSIIWSLVKQVRPGMDVAKVVLPSFILEPRSFLDKLSDYYYHADILTKAVNTDDAFSRMKMVVKWYLSGFYKKPKGLKKPYNPILKERFRCYWKHPETGSRTFYVAEQLSHHPPISGFYVTNRQDGFAISGSILMKSKFYGNSISAILDGEASLSFLKRGEDYVITMPYAYCKGILIGTLTMELGGKVSIECEKNGYKTEMEFKLKPFLGSGEASNKVVGKIKLGTETLATISGRWDQEVYIKDKSTGETELLWNPTPEIKGKRLKRYVIPMQSQAEMESERLWAKVSEAIAQNDQKMATNEKYILEEAQREEAKEREAKMLKHQPSLFEQNPLNGQWLYKYADSRPWDHLNDLLQYEHDFVIQTKTRHRTPLVRTTSIANVHDSPICNLSTNSRNSQSPISLARNVQRGRGSIKTGNACTEQNGSMLDYNRSDSSDSAEGPLTSNKVTNLDSLKSILQPIIHLQKENSEKLSSLQGQVATIQRQVLAVQSGHSNTSYGRDLFLVASLLALQTVLYWLFRL